MDLFSSRSVMNIWMVFFSAVLIVIVYFILLALGTRVLFETMGIIWIFLTIILMWVAGVYYQE